MNRLQRYRFLCIFGDGLLHNWWEIVYLGVISLKMKQKDFENGVFKQALGCGLIRKVETEKIRATKLHAFKVGIGYIIGWEDYEYKITTKGRECLGNEQIDRGGDYNWYNVSGFDGTIDSAKKINPSLFKEYKEGV